LTSLKHCPQCGIQAEEDESLEHHVVRCPNGVMRHLLHSGLVGVIKSCLRDAGVLDASIFLEARGLRAADRSRPGDVVALDFFADGRHLVIDAVVTTVYRNTVLQQVATIPGYATKQSEDAKFLVVRTSSQSIASSNVGLHVLVPFAMEDGDRLGVHAQALLRALAIAALSKGRISLVARRLVDAPHPMHVSMWVRRWQQRLSAWLHVALSRHAMRLLCPPTAAGLRYI